jgi:glyoxylase-like metal-dependent hydrolase (beta-lactamase superfamily II)
MTLLEVLPVHHSPLNTAKSYLLLGERVVIVDTGPPDHDRRGTVVRRALAEAGRRPEDVSLIVATHAHPDHVGNAAALRAWTGAPIGADAREVPYLERTTSPGRTPTGIAGRLFSLTPLPHEEFDAFTPDLLVDESFDLRAFGVAADLHHVGGHTPGSLAIHVPFTGELLAIDLVAGGVGIGGIAFHGRVIEPPFHEDRPAVLRALARLLQLGDLATLHVCHGGPLRPADVATWLTRTAARLHMTEELAS